MCSQPSLMARLVWLAGLRDLGTGIYHHPATGLERRATDRLLRGLHEESFRAWLRCRPHEQAADLDLYLSALECGKAKAVDNWLRLEPYHALVPGSVTRAERRWFVARVEALLEQFAAELGIDASSVESRCPDTYLTTEQLGHWLKVPVRTLRHWAEVGEIPGIKLGRQWRFSERQLRAWLQTACQPSSRQRLAPAKYPGPLRLPP
ncbi:MAG TPA: helix-turn-helix domain-containing protein [Bryobacteraceae bacterium]|nr:helix-turn-helix domain-containing protein [Bryobacteraceae bacterium]